MSCSEARIPLPPSFRTLSIRRSSRGGAVVTRRRCLRLPPVEEAPEAVAAATASPVPYTPLKFVETVTGKSPQPASSKQNSAPAKFGRFAGSTYSVQTGSSLIVCY